MATIGILGPYSGQGSLEPGEARWVDFGGDHDGLAQCALSVSASGAGDDGGTYVLKADNVNISCIKKIEGDIDYRRYYAGCNVTNTGATVIRYWQVTVGVIAP